MSGFTADFALNHMAAPRLSIRAFMELAVSLGIGKVEIRNDLSGASDVRNVGSAEVKAMAADLGLTIISVNALQRWNQWAPEKAAEAAELIKYCADCCAKALVLVPTNDTSFTPSESERKAGHVNALSALKSMLQDAGVMGLIEPLGFVECSLRRKSDAVAAIKAVQGENTFRLVHDTFHHFVAGETDMFPAFTGLVHISGVTEPAVTQATMRDPHRVLVDASDRIDNSGQVKALMSRGYCGPLSFEPFAAEVHALADPKAAIAASMAYLKGAIGT